MAKTAVVTLALGGLDAANKMLLKWLAKSLSASENGIVTMLEQDERRESVWQYPRPPRLEPSSRHLKIVHGGSVIAETTRSMRVLETSHPPVYYFPPEDVAMELLRQSKHTATACEFKGMATYWTLDLTREPLKAAGGAGSPVVLDAAWSYENPLAGYVALCGYLAFYASRVDACYVDGERVNAQPGDFYGGWITSDIDGPFKGGAGTLGW